MQKTRAPSPGCHCPMHTPPTCAHMELQLIAKQSCPWNCKQSCGWGNWYEYGCTCVLVRFFDKDMGKVVTHHFGSRRVNIADASTLTNEMAEILHSLNWDQVVSVLLDNCSVMRWKQSGVETQIRQQNESLLDVSGDTVHIVSKLCQGTRILSKMLLRNSAQMCIMTSKSFRNRRNCLGAFQSLLHFYTWRTRAWSAPSAAGFFRCWRSATD